MIRDTGQELVVIGGGRIGEALVGGLLAHGRAPTDLTIVEIAPKRRAELAAAYPDIAIVDAPVIPESAVLAVKPGESRRRPAEWPTAESVAFCRLPPASPLA